MENYVGIRGDMGVMENKTKCADHNQEQNSDFSTVAVLTELPHLDSVQSKNLAYFLHGKCIEIYRCLAYVTLWTMAVYFMDYMAV